MFRPLWHQLQDDRNGSRHPVMVPSQVPCSWLVFIDEPLVGIDRSTQRHGERQPDSVPMDQKAASCGLLAYLAQCCKLADAAKPGCWTPIRSKSKQQIGPILWKAVYRFYNGCKRLLGKGKGFRTNKWKNKKTINIFKCAVFAPIEILKERESRGSRWFPH